ncbi:MAG TPA: ABC transporter permease [Thermoanaerobaculia bacterium]|nr:ABC transporter permease [Thermoanaerobaculia bacterium]
MTTYLVRRLLYAVLTFLGITIASFTLIHSVPGDPITFFMVRSGNRPIPPAVVQAIRHEHWLDRPLPVQYAHWLRGALALDFGRSTIDRRAVRTRVFEKLPRTLLLGGTALILSALIGIPIGLWSAARSGRKTERASAVLFFLLYSLPTFWVALLLMQWLAVKLELLPLFGMTSDDYEYLTAPGRFADRVRHLILPVITLAYGQVAVFARFSKSALTEVIRQDFITTARAKGASSAAVYWNHAFRNALLPIITLVGVSVPYMLSGSLIVEAIFQWDGIGLLYYDAIYARDYPTVMGLTVMTAIVTLIVSLLADMLYAFVDPRIRLAEASL